MTKSEIRKIRKRIDAGLSNIKAVYGCYVNAAGEIIATMSIPVEEMEMEEREMYSALLKKGISGPKERHIMELRFDAGCEEIDEHKLLMGLADSRLEDGALRDTFYKNVASSLDLKDKGYAIILVSDTFDIQSRFEEDEEWTEDSESQFTYFICSICEVKNPKAMLKYLAKPKEFRGASTGSILAAPVLGFMFPEYDEGSANIYSTSFYSRNPTDNHEEFIKSLFPVKDPPLSSEMQKEAFNSSLSKALGDDCSMDVVTSIQSLIASTLCEKGTECSIVTPEITTGEVGEILRSKGISDAKIESFEKEVEKKFGTDTVATANLLQKDSFTISSSEADIIVDPENAARIKTKVIDGIRYFLVPVGADVKINGVDIVMDEDD